MASGTFRRFTRMRVQVDDRPRMESTSTSSMAKYFATAGCLEGQQVMAHAIIRGKTVAATRSISAMRRFGSKCLGSPNPFLAPCLRRRSKMLLRAQRQLHHALQQLVGGEPHEIVQH